ncbi:flavodoxin oxidoreductase [Oleiphilus messinensis]|uniref:Flavodoxin oxidoreductase n=1 Tax=Oleiphilus messinensis TaxID=141451 RepID=A0A1Y0I755_9GAMM|nr:ferredoxin reductase [Oleiphilus messinensis]ARU55345.1 flavodoxin oxidoreductase [Oleiphilus messinensis]
MSNQTHTAESNRSVLLSRTTKWISQALFNTDTPAEYFDVLAESINPMWSLTETRARVLEVISETADTKTLVLQPVSNWKGFEAGQHLQLSVTINGSAVTRTFSLSSAPSLWLDQGLISITIKRVPEGRVTGWIHESLRSGDIVSLSPAQGEFTLPANTDTALLYIAAGSGITPIMSQIRTIEAGIESEETDTRPVTLIYYANKADEFIFGQELKTMDQKHDWLTVKCFATEEAGLICADHVRPYINEDFEHAYVCGPQGFRDIAKELIQSHKSNLPIHEEVFVVSPLPVDGEAEMEHQLTFSKSHREVTGTNQMPLLDQAEAAGLSPKSGCRIGICHTCKCTKQSGRVRNMLTGEISDGGKEEIQLCIAVPVTDVTLAL